MSRLKSDMGFVLLDAYCGPLLVERIASCDEVWSVHSLLFAHIYEEASTPLCGIARVYASTQQWLNDLSQVAPHTSPQHLTGGYAVDDFLNRSSGNATDRFALVRSHFVCSSPSNNLAPR